MGNKLNNGIRTVTQTGEGADTGPVRDARAMLGVTLLYLTALLSMPLEDPAGVLWFGIYPIIGSALLGQSFNTVFLKSLVILPLILLVGIFNPILDHSPGITVGPFHISHGWTTFLSITLRGLLALQALLLLVMSCGFVSVCRTLRSLWVPSFLTTQLELVYRYSITLMEELKRMRMARAARGYGRRSMDLRVWGPMIGQLFIRSVDRAARIHKAMLCRGFSGTMPDYRPRRSPWTRRDTVYILFWSVIFACLRFYSPARLPVFN